MKTQKTFLMQATLLAFIVMILASCVGSPSIEQNTSAAPLSAQAWSEVPSVFKNALLQVPENAVMGIGVADRALLAQVFARVDIARQLHGDVQYMIEDFLSVSDYSTQFYFEQIAQITTRVAFSELGLRTLTGRGADTQEYVDVLISDHVRVAYENQERVFEAAFQEMTIRIEDTSGNLHFISNMRASETHPELNSEGTIWFLDLEFVTGTDRRYHWEVIESRDTRGQYWALVIRHDDFIRASSLPPMRVAPGLMDEHGVPVFVHEALQNRAAEGVITSAGLASDLGNFNLQRAVATTRAMIIIAQQIEHEDEAVVSSSYYVGSDNSYNRSSKSINVGVQELRNIRIIASGMDMQGNHWVVVELGQ